MTEIFSRILIDWYKLNKRNLPWRHTKDPYRIWISEIILQQTRVVQGYEYFVRFMEHYPNVNLLAAAESDEVMKLWQGLGYYSRARNLHEAAKSIAAAGEFPKTYEGVRALKGVGDYTAAAICSFAYNLPYAVVDGNVYRVLSRWMGIDTPIDSSEGKKLFAALAQELLDKEEPGLYNQAIMDFGALQCTPSSPDCLFCPLAESCVARKNGRVGQLPVKQHKTKITNRYFNYIYVRAGAFTFINRRNDKDIWKNLYELPLVETSRELSEEEFYADVEAKALFAEGEEPLFRCLKKKVKHVLSHRIIYANFYEVTLPEDTRSFNQYIKIPVAKLEQYAVPRLIHQFLEENGIV